MSVSQLSKFAAALASLLILLSALATAQDLQIGSSNTAFADALATRL